MPTAFAGVFSFAISTSICRNRFTICQLTALRGHDRSSSSEFSLISPGTKKPVTSQEKAAKAKRLESVRTNSILERENA